jgi:hypothetical protein
MAGAWRIIAFPLILPWRPEFWTLPLYFPELTVGVTPDWPADTPYQGMPLPPEARKPSVDYQSFAPGELTQWQAFQQFQQSREEVDDIVRALRGAPEEPQPERRASPEAWTLAWQMEKMQADQEAQMALVDRGHDWLEEIFRPEPWADPSGFGPVAGVKEVADPELARLRYLLWRRVMGEAMAGAWAPLLLGRGAGAVFGALLGWPEWTFIGRTVVNMPGVKDAAALQAAQALLAASPWQGQFQVRLEACLEAAAGRGDLKAAAGELTAFAQGFAQAWTEEPAWWWPLEIWTRPENSAWEWGPVLCGAPDGKDILPG